MRDGDDSGIGNNVSLSDFFALLRYGYKLIAAGVIVGVALAAIAVFVVPKTYTATSVVTVNPIAADPLADGGGRSDVNTTTEAAILRSTTVAALAANQLGGDQAPRELLSSLRVTAPRESEVLEIQFDAGSPPAPRGARTRSPRRTWPTAAASSVTRPPSSSAT